MEKLDLCGSRQLTGRALLDIPNSKVYHSGFKMIDFHACVTLFGLLQIERRCIDFASRRTANSAYDRMAIIMTNPIVAPPDCRQCGSERERSARTKFHARARVIGPGKTHLTKHIRRAPDGTAQEVRCEPTSNRPSDKGLRWIGQSGPVESTSRRIIGGGSNRACGLKDGVLWKGSALAHERRITA
jgi:hypothetical protein